jgi:hypothetical protein
MVLKMSNEQEREARDIAWQKSLVKANGNLDVANFEAFNEGWQARAALDTPKQSTSCELNKEGLEAAAKAHYECAENAIYPPRWGALSESGKNNWRKPMQAAIQAYLPYHNAALQQVNTPLIEQLTTERDDARAQYLSLCMELNSELPQPPQQQEGI